VPLSTAPKSISVAGTTWSSPASATPLSETGAAEAFSILSCAW
jgi:hypothetical protein